MRRKERLLAAHLPDQAAANSSSPPARRAVSVASQVVTENVEQIPPVSVVNRAAIGPKQSPDEHARLVTFLRARSRSHALRDPGKGLSLVQMGGAIFALVFIGVAVAQFVVPRSDNDAYTLPEIRQARDKAEVRMWSSEPCQL